MQGRLLLLFDIATAHRRPRAEAAALTELIAAAAGVQPRQVETTISVSKRPAAGDSQAPAAFRAGNKDDINEQP